MKIENKKKKDEWTCRKNVEPVKVCQGNEKNMFRAYMYILIVFKHINTPVKSLRGEKCWKNWNKN